MVCSGTHTRSGWLGCSGEERQGRARGQTWKNLTWSGKELLRAINQKLQDQIYVVETDSKRSLLWLGVGGDGSRKMQTFRQILDVLFITFGIYALRK